MEGADTAPSITAAAASSTSAAGQPSRDIPEENLRSSLGQQPTSVRPRVKNDLGQMQALRWAMWEAEDPLARWLIPPKTTFPQLISEILAKLGEPGQQNAKGVPKTAGKGF